MRIREKLRFLREGMGFYLMNAESHEMNKPFTILAAHMLGDSNVILIKHKNKIVSIARKTKEFKFNLKLMGLADLTIEQIKGYPLHSLTIEVEMNYYQPILGVPDGPLPVWLEFRASLEKSSFPPTPRSVPDPQP